MNWVLRFKDDYLKLLAGLLVVLILLEWVSGVREALQLDTVTTPIETPVVKQAKASQTVKNPAALTVSFFGDYVPSGVDAAGVKRSSLNLSVVGILFASEATESHVMLELSDHTVKLFRVGDTVPGGAIIKRITPEGILLMHDGVMESLSLPKNELFFSPLPEALKQD
ncbi:MAG: type II secretion system protein N [Legionellaceae bacterium]|nr:type II secretion system protein N [Legionellaceae bacterium]